MNNENYITCEGCGVVLDSSTYCLEREYRLNHDQDKKCEHIKCPVCKTWTPNEKWEEI